MIDDPFHEEPVFPEEEGGGRRRLDYLGRPFPPLQREMRRHFNRLFQTEEGRSGLRAAWYVPRVAGDTHYDDVTETEDPDDIPVLLSEPGLGGAARNSFVERWAATDVFERRRQTFARPEFAAAEMADPSGLFHVDGAGCWVIVVDKPRLKGRPAPRSWEDLLHPRWTGEIVSSGQNGVALPILLFNILKLFGWDGVRAIARNVRECRGGAAMARFAGTDDPKGAPILVLPHFWAANVIRPDRAEMVWPREGAVAAPMIHLKKRVSTPAADIAEAYLTGPEWAARMESTRCSSVRDDVPARPLPGPLRWVGWDYARDLDIERTRPRLIAEYLKGREA